MCRAAKKCRNDWGRTKVHSLGKSTNNGKKISVDLVIHTATAAAKTIYSVVLKSIFYKKGFRKSCKKFPYINPILYRGISCKFNGLKQPNPRKLSFSGWKSLIQSLYLNGKTNFKTSFIWAKQENVEYVIIIEMWKQDFHHHLFHTEWNALHISKAFENIFKTI